MKDKPVIAGNWKMHHSPADARRFFETFQPILPGEAPTILVFPPAISFEATKAALPADPTVLLGVQNIHHEPSGAFTGEISAPMARGAGASHVLIGHSERRHVFGETDEMVAAKVRAAVGAGLTPVVCVGETLEDRNAGRVDEVIIRQLDAALGALSGTQDFLIAYEPVWAIGTGETATPADASAAHATLRARLSEVIGVDRARTLSILYGGSVKPANASELLSATDVDGVLVGGASLDPDSFSRIAEAG